MDRNVLSSFPSENKLVYLPNNYYVWIRSVMEHGAYEYGALATALLDEGKIQFDYVVAHIPLHTFISALTSAEGTTGSESKSTDAKSTPVINNPAPKKVTSKMVMDFPGGDPIIDHGKLLVLK